MSSVPFSIVRIKYLPSSVTFGTARHSLCSGSSQTRRSSVWELSQAVVIDLLVIIRPLQIFARFRLGKPAVEKALAVGGPLGFRELDPLQVVGKVLPVATSRTFHSFQSEPAAAMP